jgi:hypothetical protein
MVNPRFHVAPLLGMHADQIIRVRARVLTLISSSGARSVVPAEWRRTDYDPRDPGLSANEIAQPGEFRDDRNPTPGDGGGAFCRVTVEVGTPEGAARTLAVP